MGAPCVCVTAGLFRGIRRDPPPYMTKHFLIIAFVLFVAAESANELHNVVESVTSIEQQLGVHEAADARKAVSPFGHSSFEEQFHAEKVTQPEDILATRQHKPDAAEHVREHFSLK